MLLHLGAEAKSHRVKAIFANASHIVPRNLKTLTESIDARTGSLPSPKAWAIFTKAH